MIDLVLSCRQSDWGSEPADEVRAERGGLTGDQPWVVFVHGATVDAGRAVDQAEHLFQGTVLPPRTGVVVYQWPATFGRFRMRSRWRYPDLVERARTAGALLAAYLADHGPSDLVVVGQSLGALVVLEAARLRPAEGPGSIRAVLLTGAAVEEGLAKIPGPFAGPVARREVILHSERDLVLGSLFEAGQRRSHPGVPSSPAVGLHGRPDVRWTSADEPPSERQDTKAFDHAYWHQPVARAAVSRVADDRLLGAWSGLARWMPSAWWTEEWS